MSFDTHSEPRNRAERRAAARATGKGKRTSAAVLLASGSTLASAAMVLGGGSVVGAATTITVDSTGDAAPVAAHCTNVTAGDCTLRDAAAAVVDGDTIQFNLPAASTITLTQGQIKFVNKSLMITGPGAANLTIDGNTNDRIFYIDGPGSKTVTISGLTFTHGEIGNDGGAIADFGEGLTILDSVFKNNKATEGNGGAVYVEDTTADITIRGSEFTGNSAVYDGGAIATNGVYGTITIADTTISGNTASGSGGSQGGGLYVSGGDSHLELANAVKITNTRITGNVASEGGGAMLDDIYGPITISDSTISGNTAESGRGGGLYIEDAYFGATVTNTQFAGNTSHDDGGGVAVRGGHGAFAFTGVTISGNVADGAGGGFWTSGISDTKSTAATLTIQTSTISGNSATHSGGGVAIGATYRTSNYADVTILDTTISGNTADGGGGGVLVSYSYGLTSIIQSTISGNVAKGGEGKDYDGGAVAFRSAENTTNLLRIVQSTITNNTGRNVGGVYVPAESKLTSKTTERVKPADTGPKKNGAKNAKKDTNETSAHTSAHTRGSTRFPPGIVTSTGTILAGNAGEDVGVAGTLKAQSSIFTKIDASVSITDLGGNQANVANLFLGPLQNNGGPTDTHALLPGSPAIDAGQVPPPSYPTNDFDQRGDGFTRVVAGVIDVGAFEVQPPPVIQPTFTG